MNISPGKILSVVKSITYKYTLTYKYTPIFTECTALTQCIESPVQFHISFTPHILSSSSQEHLLIKSTEFYSCFYTNIQDGLGRFFPSISAVQKTHLERKRDKMIRCQKVKLQKPDFSTDLSKLHCNSTKACVSA